MQITLTKLSEIHPYPKNARKIPQSAIDAVAKSIQEFGWQQPIVVDRDGVIIVGHCRLLAAQKLGLAEAPVHVAEHLTPAQVRQYRLMDNRSHEEAKWDMDILTAEMLELKALDLDLSLTGFSSGELDRMTRNPLDGEDEVPPVPECPVTRPGDLWVMGRHRVLCGDATKPGDVARLMGGARADMVFTDPPYGVAVCGGTHDPRDKKNHGKGPRIQNDAMPDGEFLKFLRTVLVNCSGNMKDGAAVYVCHADTKGRIFREAFDDAGFFLHCVVIWVKQQFVFGRSDYHWQHEPILYGWRQGAAHQFMGERNQGTTWNIDRPMRSDKEHPTQKPVALVEKAISNSSKGGDVVLDVFGGAGSTLVACEKTGRQGALLELDTKYVDVIVTRWQNLTGKEATVGDGPHKGCTFAHAKHGRQLEGQDAILEEVLNGAS